MNQNSNPLTSPISKPHFASLHSLPLPTSPPMRRLAPPPAPRDSTPLPSLQHRSLPFFPPSSKRWHSGKHGTGGLQRAAGAVGGRRSTQRR